MTSKVIPGEGMKSELDLFMTPLTSKQIEWASYVKHLPSAPIANSDVIEFTITPIKDQYIDLSKTKLYIRGKYVNSRDGSDLAENEKFCPTNLPGHSMFKQCTVLFNDKHVSSGAQTFQHTSYIETVTSFKKSTKETTLRSALYYEDTAGHFDVTDFTGNTATNTGAKKRNEAVKGSKTIEMSIKLHSPVFNMDKFIMGNVKISVKLTKAAPEFYIMRAAKSLTGAANAEQDSSPVIFKFEHMYLTVFKVKPVNNVYLAQQAILLKTPAKYVLPYVDTKIFSIPQGFGSISFDNIFLDLIPSRIILFMVDADAFVGTYTKNPYNLQHNNLNYLVLVKDGVHHPPEGYTPDFTNQRFLECFEDTLECLDLWGRDKNNGITPEMYINGFTFFTWDLTTDMSAASNNFNQPLDGTLRF